MGVWLSMGICGGTLVECWRLWDYRILGLRELMYIGGWIKCFGGIEVILWPLVRLWFGGFFFVRFAEAPVAIRIFCD